MSVKAKLTFYGGTGTVTGANFLLEIAGIKILVDCGLVQGDQNADNLNRTPFLYDPASIDFLLVTHAHTDHIGRIGKLVKDGFHGQILSADNKRQLINTLNGNVFLRVQIHFAHRFRLPDFSFILDFSTFSLPFHDEGFLPDHRIRPCKYF